MSNRERRAMTAEIRAEVDENGEGRTLEGYAALFGSTTDLGYMTEEIAPGAFADVLSDDVRCLFNHDPNHILGRTSSGTLEIAQDSRGLRFACDINQDDPDAMKLHAQVSRGDVTGNSFSFTIAEDAWDYTGEKPHRKILKLGELYDVGPVTFPAYEATELSARSLEAAKREKPAPAVPPSHEVLRKTLDLAAQS